ncbi:MAG: hypothetical protein ABS900_12250, partial [Candidatus Limivicinus sp.]
AIPVPCSLLTVPFDLPLAIPLTPRKTESSYHSQLHLPKNPTSEALFIEMLRPGEFHAKIGIMDPG